MNRDSKRDDASKMVSYKPELYEKIKYLDKIGHFNLLIKEAAESFQSLIPVIGTIVARIAFLIENHAAYISDDSIQALQSAAVSVKKFSILQDKLEALTRNGSYKPGEIWFPVTASGGMMRKIIVHNLKHASCLPARQNQINRVGAAVFSFIEKKSGHPTIWKPDAFYFNVLDIYGKEDLTVEGNSMDLPLALALYSFVTGIPVDYDLSASCEVTLPGKLKHVGNISAKVNILKEEGFFIKRFLVSHTQKQIPDIKGIEPVKVKSVRDALEYAFPGKICLKGFSGEIDIKKDTDQIKELYRNYRYDTCIINAQQIVSYIKSGNCNAPQEEKIRALFSCCWRAGSSFCHKGNIKSAQEYLIKAEKIYLENPGVIQKEDFYNLKINYCVLLKDIFRYKDAVTLHKCLIKELDDKDCSNSVKVRNLSSLSQAYLAMRKYVLAEKYQNRAIELVESTEKYRNITYMAQICFRRGDFRSAKNYFKKVGKIDSPSAHKIFFDWFMAESIYLEGHAKKKRRQTFYKPLYAIESCYPDVNSYQVGLIKKFAGLAMLEDKREKDGVKVLDEAVSYLESSPDFMYHILAATARAWRSLYFISVGSLSEARKDIKKVKQVLSSQKDVKLFFKADTSRLSSFLRLKKPGNEKVLEVKKSIKSVISRIPY